MVTKKGTIRGISGHPMSGLWTLEIEDSTGAIDLVHISSGTGVRALAACFDAHEGTGDLLEKITGQEIYYSVDWMNVLEGFTPVDQAPAEMVERFESDADEFGELHEDEPDDDVKDFLGIGF